MSRDRRRAARVAAGRALGVMLVGAVLGVACGDSSGGIGAAEDTAEAFARAWSERDGEAVTDLAVDGRATARALNQISAALDVRQAEVVVTSVEETASGATAGFTATLGLGGLGRWDYEGEFDLVWSDGSWRVAWAPEGFHPALVDGASLGRTREQGARGQLLARFGQPITTSGTAGRRPLIAEATVGKLGEIDQREARRRGLRYQAGDVVGSSGLEQGLDEELTVAPVGQVHVVRPDGTQGEVLARFGGGEATPVQTTLDLTLQTFAEQALAPVTLPAAMVVIDPATGEIRASANSPSGFDRAVLGEYPPGSTFKIVTASAMLADGIEPKTRLPCPLETRPGDAAPFVNAFGKDLGTVSFRTAFAESCNTTFVDSGFAMGGERLQEEAALFGFGPEWNPGVAAVRGDFVLPETDTELAAAAIGQGRVSVSPLHMASVAAAAYDGTWRPPHFVGSAAQPDLEAPLDERSAEVLPDFLRSVVEDGSGTEAAVQGHDVGGKTGTAEFGDEDPPESHAWFIGFADGVAFAIVVEGGGVGGSVAGPIAADFVSRLPQPDAEGPG